MTAGGIWSISWRLSRRWPPSPFAYRASLETVKLRRADRLAEVADAIADAASEAVSSPQGVSAQKGQIARLRLKAAIASSREHLPLSEALVDFLGDGLGKSGHPEIPGIVEAALDEVSERLGQEKAT